MAENHKKRLLESEDRAIIAKRILDEKKKNYKPADSSKEYVCCYDCVSNDTSQTISKQTTIVMQRSFQSLQQVPSR